MAEAGYTTPRQPAIKGEVDHYEKVRDEVKLASGDYVDMKMYEPAMRHLLDTYIRAEESEKISAFDDTEPGRADRRARRGAVDELPEGIKNNPEAVAETIENNVRRVIIDEQPGQPEVLREDVGTAGCPDRGTPQGQALDYKAVPGQGRRTRRQVQGESDDRSYPTSTNTPARRALYDNLGQDETWPSSWTRPIRTTKKDGWRGNWFKETEVRHAISQVVERDDELESHLRNGEKPHEYCYAPDHRQRHHRGRGPQGHQEPAPGRLSARGRVRVAAPLRVDDEAVRLAVFQAGLDQAPARALQSRAAVCTRIVNGESHYYGAAATC